VVDAVAVGPDGAARRAEPLLAVTTRVGRLDLASPPGIPAVGRDGHGQRRDLGAGVVMAVAPEFGETGVGAAEERTRRRVIGPDLLLVGERRVALLLGHDDRRLPTRLLEHAAGRGVVEARDCDGL